MQASGIKRMIGIFGAVASCAAVLALPVLSLATDHARVAGSLAIALRHHSVNPEATLRTADNVGTIKLRLIGADGEMLLQRGNEPAWPRITREATVKLADGEEARLEVEGSLRSAFQTIPLLTLIGILLGMLVYYIGCVLPTRVIDRTLSALRVQNRRFDLAVNNMSQGLCFFDGDARLIVCNDRYLEMYGLPAGSVPPGTTLREIVDRRFEVGSHPKMTPEEYVVWRSSLAVIDRPVDTVSHLINGATILIRHRPMPDGGWVATHEDITDAEDGKQRLAQQMQRFDAALNNMPHGLSMFDADRRLIVCNRKYKEMYRLPAHLAVPGTLYEDIIRYRQDTNQEVSDRALYEREARDRADRNKAMHYRKPLMDGRIIQIDFEPMLGGGWVTTHQDITQATEAEAKISHMAQHDALTALPNRTAFREKLEAALEAPDRDTSVAVLYLDLDRFKVVNDTLGHALGDELLEAVAGRLKLCIDDTDTIARLGGDEFAIIQTAAKQPDAATELASRIVSAIAYPFDLERHQGVTIGTSVGIALPRIEDDAVSILEHADLALYFAKANGRGGYRIFDPSMARDMLSRRAMERELRQAFEKDELELHYQPIVNLESGRIVSFEALLRWNHPERGILPAGEFVNLAEETGLIVPLGKWVIEQACAAAAKWPLDVKISVNLSALQFHGRTLALHTLSALERSGLSPQRLDLEITESVLLHESETVMTTLRGLKDLGITITLDDFGTGYSSMRYLQQFPFDRLKIDRGFVAGVLDNKESAAIVDAIIGLGNGLGRTTTAEGVETAEQMRELRNAGCIEAQGYYFSPAVPEREIGALWAKINRAAA